MSPVDALRARDKLADSTLRETGNPMTLIGLGIGLLAIGVVLALGTTEDDIGWLLCVAGVVILVVVAIMSATANRRRP
jgi:hypothetical protein